MIVVTFTSESADWILAIIGLFVVVTVSKSTCPPGSAMISSKVKVAAVGWYGVRSRFMVTPAGVVGLVGVTGFVGLVGAAGLGLLEQAKKAQQKARPK